MPEMYGSQSSTSRNVPCLPCFDPLRELAAPGPEAVDPRLDGEPVGAELGDHELGAPAVVGEGHHRYLGRGRVALVAVPDDAGERVMAVGENVGLDRHLLAHGPLGREAPRVDLGRDRLDGDPFSSVWTRPYGGSSGAKRR